MFQSFFDFFCLIFQAYVIIFMKANLLIDNLGQVMHEVFAAGKERNRE